MSSQVDESSSAEAAHGTAIATVEELSSVEAAMDIGAAIGVAIGAAIGATATEASCPPSCLSATPMVVAVAAMLGATAAVSVSADELGDQAFAAWFGALVQHSAPLQFTKPSRTHACFYLASGMRVNMRSIAVQVALCRLLPGPASELGPKKKVSQSTQACHTI